MNQIRIEEKIKKILDPRIKSNDSKGKFLGKNKVLKYIEEFS